MLRRKVNNWKIVFKNMLPFPILVFALMLNDVFLASLADKTVGACDTLVLRSLCSSELTTRYVKQAHDTLCLPIVLGWV